MLPAEIPDDWYRNPAVWSYGVAALGFAAFCVQLSVGWRGGGRAILFLAAITLSVFWCAVSAMFSVNPGAALWRSAQGFDVLRTVAALAFLAAVLGRMGAERISSPGTAARPIGLLALILSLAALALFLGLPRLGGAGSVATAAFAVHLTLALLGVVLAEQVYRHSAPERRWNIRPLCLGLAGPFVLDVVVYSDAMLFRGLDPHLWAARGFASALALPLLGIAARRNRDWSFDVSVSHGVIAGSTAILVSGIYLLLIAAAGYYVRYFGGHWGKTLQVVVIFGALLLLGFVSVSGTARAQLRVLVAKNFFSYKFDYREEWLKFTRRFSAKEQRQPIEEVCIEALADLVESTGGSLWTRQAAGGAYSQSARLNHPRIEAIETSEGSLPAFLERTGWIIEVDGARTDPSSQGGVGLPDWLLGLPAAWLVVPLIVGEELFGYVVLDRPRANFEVNWEVRDLLKTAASQAGSYLAMSRATDALLEVRKFDAFNRMSAFVVHDLKNLVAQLQLMLRNAKKHHANPEFQRDMLETVAHVVERMTLLMRQLRVGEQPVERPRPVLLADVARRVARSSSFARDGLTIDCDDSVCVIGHEDRLERVIGHLVQNGFDAGGDNAVVHVRVARRDDDAVVEVSDNGVGMTADFIRHELFKPFQTTKSHGMGIGAYESHQYVLSLGGQIVVSSQPGVGTQMQIVLPQVRQEQAVPATESA
jgi:putative PEP-CTERM system histidine kinase